MEKYNFLLAKLGLNRNYTKPSTKLCLYSDDNERAIDCAALLQEIQTTGED